MSQSQQTVGRPERQCGATGKRIVSKAEYAKVQGKRAYLSLELILYFVGCVVAGWSLLRSLSVAWQGLHQNTKENLIGGVCVAAIHLGYLIVLGKWACEVFVHVRTIDPGVPLTRANAADLPAPESLVRASEKPVQEQQAILLRAANKGMQTPTEQLLRPALSAPKIAEKAGLNPEQITQVKQQFTEYRTLQRETLRVQFAGWRSPRAYFPQKDLDRVTP